MQHASLVSVWPLGVNVVCHVPTSILLIPFTLAGPALVSFILLLDLTVSRYSIWITILYQHYPSQSLYISSMETNFFLSVFIVWFNLDLDVETCFFEGLDAYYKTWLQFVFPFYIWSIAELIIILSKYSSRVAKVMGNNSVPVLASLFLLSYAKLFRIIISALSYTILYTSDGRKAVWSADGNVDYLSPKHIYSYLLLPWHPCSFCGFHTHSSSFLISGYTYVIAD